MKKTTLFFIFPGLLLSVFIPGIQAQVTFTFHQPPPNQWKMEYMWNLTISNSFNKDTNVYLTGTLEEKKQGLIAKATSKKFYKAKRGSHSLLVNELEPIHKDYSNSKYEDVLKKTATLPDGTYIICVTVYSESGDELFKDCFEQVITNMSPPELTAPGDDSMVDQPMPVFMWLPPMPAPTGEIITYSIKIVELMDGQVPIESMEANPAFYIEQNISSPTFQLPVKAKPFYSGKSYAWQVTAYGKNYVVGQSQVWSFVYGESQCHTKTGNVKVECNGTDNYGNQKYKVTVEFSNLNNDPNCITYLCFPSPVGSNAKIPTPKCNYLMFVQGSCAISDLRPDGGSTLPFGVTNLTFNMTNPTLPIKIDVQSGSICNGSGTQCAPSFIIDTLPPCQCNDCKEMVVTFDNFNTAPYGNNGYRYNITGTININMPIYSLECQVQSYKFTATPATCSNGVTNIVQSGMFLMPTSLNGITALERFNETISGLPTSNKNAAKAVKLSLTTPITGAIPVNFTVGLPGPITGLPPDCCKMEYTVCVKVIVFYDAEKCKSCTFIHCFDFTNQ